MEVLIVFDFFKDLYFEMNDYDMEMIRKEKEEKIKKEKEETIIFSRKTKAAIFVTGSLLMLISMFALIISVQKNDVGGIIKTIFNIILDAVTIVCIMIKKRQTEIIGLVGIVFILIITFALPMV